MNVFFFDLETFPFGQGRMLPPPVCMSYATAPSEATLVLAHQITQVLGPVLEDAVAGKTIITGFGVDYDFGVILAHVPELWYLVWSAYMNNGVTCCRLRERLLDIAEGTLRSEYDPESENLISKGYDLGDVMWRRLRVKLDKESLWRTRYGELVRTPLDQWPEGARRYVLDDSGYGPNLFQEQEIRGRRLRYSMPTQFDEARAALALRLTSAWGVRTDEARVRSLWQKTGEEITSLKQTLVDYGVARVKKPGGQIDWTTGKEQPMETSKNTGAIRDLIRATWPQGLGPIPTTDTGMIQTGKEVLLKCDHPALDTLIEHNGIEKMRSTYISRYFDGFDGPIHPGYDAVGAESDRTSSWKPNWQNQPRKKGLRECIVPRPGKVFLAADFDAQEMRTWAQSCLDLTGVSPLAKMFQADPDFDPHTWFAAERFLKVSYEEGMRLKAARDKVAKSRRQRAKAANFGFPGGLGAETFLVYARGYGEKLTIEESIQTQREWLDFMQARPFFDHVQSVIGSVDFGKQVIPRSGFTRNGVNYCNCANGYFQTPAAHASKRALWEVTLRCYADPTSPLYGARPVWFIHDEVGLEIDEAQVFIAGPELARIMEEAMAVNTPDIPPRASATAMRCWSKEAEPTYDQHGNLIPWEEEA